MIRTKLRAFSYMMKQGMLNVVRNKMMLLASLCVMIATLFVFGTFYVLSRNINYQIENNINKEYEVSLYLLPELSDKEADQFEKLIINDSRIRKYRRISKEEAFNDYKNLYPEDEFEFVFGGTTQEFLPISFDLKLEDMNDADAVIESFYKVSADDLRKAAEENDEDNNTNPTETPNSTSVPGSAEPESTMAATAKPTGTPVVQDGTPQPGSTAVPDNSQTDSDDEVIQEAVWNVKNATDIVKSVNKMSNIINIAGIVVLGLFIFYSVVVISNTIMLTVFARKREIAIMKNIGATGAYVRGPFIVEGCLLGIVGAVIAFILISYAYNFLGNVVLRDFMDGGIFNFTLLDFDTLKYKMFAYFALLGIVIGGGGAILSVNKHIKN